MIGDALKSPLLSVFVNPLCFSATMSISIEDLHCPSETHQTYIVTISSEPPIETLVTHSSSEVSTWITHVQQLNPNQTPLIVGLDIEWRPNFTTTSDNPPATLQLCVGSICLIFQLLYTPQIPKPLIDFLNDPNHTFVGIGIKTDVEKLLLHYNVRVAKTFDVGRMGGRRIVGLKELAKEVLGLEINKPKKVTMSVWDAQWLSYAQIQYACVDAYLSYKIGKTLLARNSW